MNELFITINRNSREPLYVQIYKGIKKEIIEGNILTNTSLPSIRKMSEQLQVNKTTLEAAYDQLIIEGLIESKPRSGHYVKEIDIGYFNTHEGNEVLTVEKKVESNYKYDFNIDHVDVENFPISTWKRLTNEVLSYGTNHIFNTGNPQGELGLRREIASYVRNSRGVRCSEEQIIIGSHSQILLWMICNLIGLRGKTVAVGEPGYPHATNIFESFECNIAPTVIEGDGMNEEDLKRSGASLVFTSPSFQFPFGNIMKIQKRIHLLKWAVQHNAYIVEDDYLSEYRYSGELIPSLQNLDQHERVIYMGTFHGTILPAINIGYIVLPKHLLAKYHHSQFELQQTTSRIAQKTLELFMRDGHWEQHRFRMKEIYKKKYKVTLKTIKKCFKEKAIVLNGQTGLHIVMQVIINQSEQVLLQKARDANIHLDSLSDYWYRKENNPFKHPVFLIGFGGMSIDQIEKGISVLYNTWFN